ncbi:MAG: type II secretion system protein N [Sedimenticola sp.]
MNAGISFDRLLLPMALLGATALLLMAGYRAGVMLYDKGQSATADQQVVSVRPTQAASRERAPNYAELSGWHLFGISRGQAKAPEKRVVSAPETRLNLELLGIFADKNSSTGWAIISERGGDQKSYRPGDRLPGNAVLEAIGSGKVTLRRNGRYESLSIKKQTLGDHAIRKTVTRKQ